MLDRVNMLSKIDRQLILAELKSAGSTDADILYSTKLKLLALPKAAINTGWLLIALAFIAAVTIIGIPIALGLLPTGLFMIMRGRGNRANIDKIFADYTQQLAASAR